MNYFDLLPNEAIYEICQFMSFKNLVRMKGISRRFNQICDAILGKKMNNLPVRLVILKSKYNPCGFIFVGWFPQGIHDSIKTTFCAHLKSCKMDIIDLKPSEKFFDPKNMMCYYYNDEIIDKIVHLVVIKHNNQIGCSCSVANDMTFNHLHLPIFNLKLVIGSLDQDLDMFYSFVNCWNTGLLGPEGARGYIGPSTKTHCPLTGSPIKKVEVDKIYYLTSIVNNYCL